MLDDGMSLSRCIQQYLNIRNAPEKCRPKGLSRFVPSIAGKELANWVLFPADAMLYDARSGIVWMGGMGLAARANRGDEVVVGFARGGSNSDRVADMKWRLLTIDPRSVAGGADASFEAKGDHL